MVLKTQGVVSRKQGEAGQLEEILLDPPGPGEVLVRILASGVCHTDLSFTLGYLGQDFPYLLGHEGAGIIEETGDGVSTLAVGDYVVLAYRAPCGVCRYCVIGQPFRCAQPPVGAPRFHTRDGQLLTPVLGLGTFSTHTVVSARKAIRMPRECPPSQACLIGCGVMTGVGAAINAAEVRGGSSVAVFGCGGVGTSVIQGARLARAGMIIGVDIADNKLAWAREFGATDVVNSGAADPVAAIKELTDGVGADYVFEAVGLAPVFAQAIESCALSGTVVLIGASDPDGTVSLPMMQFLRQRLTLRACLYGDCLPSRDFPLLASWYQQGDLDLDRLVSREIGLGDTQAAFEAMEKGEVLRSVIRLPEG